MFRNIIKSILFPEYKITLTHNLNNIQNTSNTVAS